MTLCCLQHNVSIKTQVRDPAAVAAACRRLGLPEPVVGTAALFGGQVNGMLIRLPDWLYPAVVDLASGEVKFDVYEGRWGDRVHLERFLQGYAVEKTKLEARKKGLTATEQSCADGSICVRIVAAA